MSVHYKFKSNLDHDTVTFDGLSISVADLKKAIMQQKKIGKSSDFDLQITNAQTKEVYDSDDMLVPKNTSVIVARVPVVSGNKKNWDKPDLPLPIDDDDLGQIRYDRIVKSADLVNANTTEEDKVKAMITQSSQEYDPSKYVKSRSMTGPLPPTYTCYRCGKQGHWIKNCPTNNPDVKRSTGIPRSFMVPVDGPEHKGALLTSSGDYAVPLIDHQAYKEVKKEKPPFVPQDEPNPEPEAQIPEELLCMFCKDLLQDAVLIPCCGNSFCDECVRQVLLESDNHECPVCLESEVSPDTLIPNRFLRTAVLNFKNETGYTRIKKNSMAKPSPLHVENLESPQPSPDSTVENQPQNAEGSSSQNDKPLVTEDKSIKSPLVTEEKNDNVSLDIHAGTSETVISPKPSLDEDSQDVQPGTPLADEPPVDLVDQPLPIQTIGQDQYQYDYHSGSQYSRSHRDDYHGHTRDELLDSLEPKPISTIETITNTRKMKYLGRPAPVRQQFPSQRNHREDRNDGYTRDRDDYHNRYDKRHHVERTALRSSGHHSRYERSSSQSRYSDDYCHTDEYHDTHYDMDYENHVRGEESSRRHADRYRIAPHPVPIPPAVPIYPVATLPVPPVIPAPQVFAPQPPPPGASPIDTSHVAAAQPPPPGVGPLLPPTVSSDPPPFNKQFEDTHKDVKKIDDRSIDDKLEAFQRELEKRDRDYSRDRDSRSRSRSSDRERSRSSRSRSYSSSKSWSRSPSRSSTRSSRSRTRSPLSSRSRSRSYSPSRSRSWSKQRSYTRSRSRTRTESSRSRSRSRTEPRFRRRVDSRDRIRSPRPRSRSRSYSPKNYRHPPHRSVPYTGRHSYTPPQYGTSYQSQYGPPPAANIPVLRPDYPPHHLHSIHPVAQSLHSRPLHQEHYPIERQPKCPPAYNEMYPMYDMYPHQRYEREQRPTRYDKRQEFQKDYHRQHTEVVGRRIPGYIGDRSRDYNPRYRPPREPRKEIIRELPQVSEQEIRVVHTKETVDDPSLRKKEEKVIVKHKKHHHHHKNKELKKQESKIPVVIGLEKKPETSHNLIKVQVQSEVADNKSNSESVPKAAKNSEKVKEKKHKHKKHKIGEQVVKKKKSAKKEKIDGVQSADSDVHVKVKTKKKKNKVKSNETDSNEVVEKDEKTELSASVTDHKPDDEDAAVIENKISEENVGKIHDTSADTLDIFADEGESAILASETMPEGDSNEVENAPIENDESVIENVDDNVNSEDEAEENVEEEAALHVDVPGLSKWERMDLEEDVESRPVRRSAVIVPKEEKGSLSSDIIQRAELAILSKPLKPQIASKDKSDSKSSSAASSPEASSQHKEPELKSVVTSERLSSPSLQVTISTTKEKRSVHSRKEEKNKEPVQNQQPKRIKLDRSSYNNKTDEHRIVSSNPNKASDRVRDIRDRNADRHDRRHSPPRDVISKRALSRDRRDRDYNNRRTDREREVRYNDERLKEERRHRFAEDRYAHNSREIINNREISRTDRRRPFNDGPPQLRGGRHYDRDNVQPMERVRRTGNNRRSRSRSYDSMESHKSLRRKDNVRQRNEQVEESHHQRSIRDHSQSDTNESRARRKYSPIKAPEKQIVESDRGKRTKRDFHDDLKFEPDYDAFSDVEDKGSKEKMKRKSSSPDTSKKRLRVEKVPVESSIKDLQKADKSSSASSSAVSESDSSDSDDQKSSKNRVSDSDHKQKHKKSKHKKHKKHKHKHKKKKSHKSKRE